MKDLEEIV